MLNNKEINMLWAKAERLAEDICRAWVWCDDIEAGKKKQAELKAIVDLLVKEGCPYNGCYDEWINKILFDHR